MINLRKINNHILDESSLNGIQAKVVKSIVLSPFIIVILYSILLIFPLTRTPAIWALNENRPIELFSFFFAITGGILGLIFTWKIKQKGEDQLLFWFYLVFSFGLIFIAGEEVAWGQWFFGFETPPAIKAVNDQHEVTLHNLAVFNRHLEIFPLVFGMSGLIAIWMNRIHLFRGIAVPYTLLSWFVVITSVTAIDMFQDFIVIQSDFDKLINHLDEVIEMLVAISGFLYIWLNQRKFTKQFKSN